MNINDVILDSQLVKLAEEIKEISRRAAQAKNRAYFLKKQEQPFLSSLRNQLKLKDANKTEEAIKREAQGSEAYNNHIVGMCAAQAEADRLEAELNAVKTKWESVRTVMANEREEIKQKLYDRGS